MHKSFLAIASILAALSVALGAFGAHGLKQIVPADSVATFETGVRYQFYHTFAIFLVAILFQSFPGKLLSAAGWLFLIGNNRFLQTKTDVLFFEILPRPEEIPVCRRSIDDQRCKPNQIAHTYARARPR